MDCASENSQNSSSDLLANSESKSILREHLLNGGQVAVPEASLPLPHSFNSEVVLENNMPISDSENMVVLRPTSGDRPWVCDQCSFAFKYKNNLLEHLRFFHMKGSVPCNSCSQVFPTSRHLRLHRKHHSLEAGRCPHCRANFAAPHVSTENYKEIYLKHLPECRRCPSRASKLMDFNDFRTDKQYFTPGALTDQNNDHMILRCLFCCCSFGELKEYEVHDCMGNNLGHSDDSSETLNQPVVDMTCTSLTESDTSSPSNAQTTSDVTSKYSSTVDFNCLCIICGVNFGNDEQLSSHLYECHQPCEDSDPDVNRTSSCILEENSLPDRISLCRFCHKELPDKLKMEQHAKECKVNLQQCLEIAQAKLPKITSSCSVSTQLNICESRISNPEKINTCNLDTDNDNFIKAHHVESHVISGMGNFQNGVSESESIEPRYSKEIDVNINSANLCEVDAIFSSSNHDSNNSDINQTKNAFVGVNNADFDSKKSSFLKNLVEVRFVCKYCKKDFSERLKMKAHQKLCKMEFKEKFPLKNTPESEKSSAWSSFNNKDVLIHWVCKFCKKTFPEKIEMQTHKKKCTHRRESESVSDSNNSEIVTKWKKIEMQAHEIQCNLRKDSKEVFSWQCKICKIFLTHKSGAKAHKEKCFIESKFLTPNNDVVVKWICKYCKKDFLLRENMCNHKKVCLHRNKDKNILSSTESDMSEVMLQEKSINAPNSPVSDVAVKVVEHNLKDNSPGVVPPAEISQNIDKFYEENDSKGNTAHENMSHNSKGFEECNSKDNTLAFQTPASEIVSRNIGELKSKELLSVNVKIFIPSLGIPSVDNSSTSDASKDLSVASSINVLFKCNLCFKSCTSRKHLKQHKLEMHTFKCLKCNRFFGNNRSLWKHSKSCKVKTKADNKAKLKKYTCKKCYRIFRELYKYQLHKGSCKAIKLLPVVNEDTVIIGQNTLLRIKCLKCLNEFVGDEIFEKHTCEKSAAVSVYLVCKCTKHAFADMSTFYLHCIKCEQSGYMVTTDNGSPLTAKVHLKCGVCMRRFKSVVFYYYHILGDPSCRSKEGVYTLENISDNEEILMVDDFGYKPTDPPENLVWTCKRCKIDFPSLITRNNHDDICKCYFKDDSEDIFHTFKTSSCPACATRFSSSKKYKDHDCVKHLKHMSSCQVALTRLKIVTVGKEDIMPESFHPPPTRVRYTSTQKCVICHKKCRFGGVGLPPIGHLECFNCRRKTHKVKKKNPEYYSRSSVTDTVTDTVSNPHMDSLNSKIYLSPSIRLKMSRAKNKDKLCNGEKPQHPKKNQIFAPTSFELQSSKPLSRRCAHCKRGFSTEIQYQKHMQLSKTCFLAETSHMKTLRNGSCESNFDASPFPNLIECNATINDNPTLGKDSTGSNTIQNLQVSNYLGTNIQSPMIHKNDVPNIRLLTNQNPISSRDVNMDISINTNCIKPKQNECIIQSVVKHAAIQNKTVSMNNTSRSFLVMEHIDKVLNSKPEVKRFPVCSALQCDGWIIKPFKTVNPEDVMNSKCICGGCYRSFSKVGLLREHMLEAHERQPHIVPVLKVMEHAPQNVV